MGGGGSEMKKGRVMKGSEGAWTMEPCTMGGAYINMHDRGFLLVCSLSFFLGVGVTLQYVCHA